MPLKSKLRKALRKAWRPLGRARRSRGFGVHSPFAFRFISFVLRDRSSRYYAYPAIRKLPDGKRHFRHLSCLFRVICDRRPDIILTGHNLTETERSVITMADSRLSIISSTGADPDSLIGQRVMLYTSGLDTVLTGIARKLLATDGATVYINSTPTSGISAITAGLDHVMAFTSPDRAVMVSRRGLPSQTFEINF